MAKTLDANAAKEAYFTASQGQLIWARFRKNRTAMISAWFLIIIILCGFFGNRFGIRDRNLRFERKFGLVFRQGNADGRVSLRDVLFGRVTGQRYRHFDIGGLRFLRRWPIFRD